MTLDPRRIEVMDDRVAEILRGKSVAERLSLANGMWRSSRRVLERMIEARYPEWSKQQIRLEVNRRMSSGTS